MKTDARHFAGNLKTSKSLLGYGLLSGENIEIAVRECAKTKNIRNIKDIKIPLEVKESNDFENTIS